MSKIHNPRTDEKAIFNRLDPDPDNYLISPKENPPLRKPSSKWKPDPLAMHKVFYFYHERPSSDPETYGDAMGDDAHLVPLDHSIPNPSHPDAIWFAEIEQANQQAHHVLFIQPQDLGDEPDRLVKEVNPVGLEAVMKTFAYGYHKVKLQEFADANEAFEKADWHYEQGLRLLERHNNIPISQFNLRKANKHYEAMMKIIREWS